MARFFNTTGNCRPEWHYMIPAVPRLPEAAGLIAQMHYFVVHAPRQTGKTTTLLALAKELTASGKYAALHFSCEQARVYPEDLRAAQYVILQSMTTDAAHDLPRELRPPPLNMDGDGGWLMNNITAWARQCPRPLILFLDEIDSLSGASLLSVLSQLRAGFKLRPQEFPASIVLCGLRDVRDYKMASGGDPQRLGTSSPFNVKVESLRLGNFDKSQVEALYRQHTDDTGQVFTPEALERAFGATQGQPWLVNALAREIVEKMAVPVTEAITAEHVDMAKERLILARATHLDSLVSKLMEPRVKRIIETIVAGGVLLEDPTYEDDTLYCRDLGLIAANKPLRISNDIYKEVVLRVLASSAEENVVVDPQSFVLADGRLNIRMLLDEFVAFWCEHGDILANGLSYHEAAPQLVLMAFLQRVVNGGGYVEREYGIGRGRIDLLVRWPHQFAEGKRIYQREALELKVWRDKAKDPLTQGLKQIDQYLTKLGLDSGILVIFDRRKVAPDVEERIRFDEALTPSGKRITLLRA